MKERTTHQKTVTPAKAGIQPSRHPRAPLSGAHHAISTPSPPAGESGGEGQKDLAPHWTLVRLADICEIIQGQSPPGSTYNTAGDGLPFFQGKAEFGDLYPTTVKWCTHPTKIAEKNDILISIRAPVGPTNLSPGKACIGRGLAAVRPHNGIPAKYVLYGLRATESQLTTKGTGSTFSAISGKDLRNHRLALAPEDQRENIVAEIEKQFTRLDAAVAALKRLQTNLKRYRAAVLKAACEGPWPQRPLGKIAEVKLGKMLDRAKRISGSKLPYLRNINVRWGTIETDDLLDMYFKDSELERYSLRTGDVLVCEGGEPGRAAVWNGLLPNMKYQKAIHRVRFNMPFEPHLLVYLLERLAKTGGLERHLTGSTIKHLTREAFVELPVLVPPLTEQTRIVEGVERRLSAVEELEASVAANLRRASRLRQAILKMAFEGKLVKN